MVKAHLIIITMTISEQFFIWAIWLIISITSCIESAERIPSNNCSSIPASSIVIDISSVFKNILEEGNSELLNKLEIAINHADKNKPLIFYYETDLDEELLEKLSRITDVVHNLSLSNAAKTLEILLSLRYNTTEIETYNATEIETYNATEIETCNATVSECYLKYFVPKHFLSNMEHIGSHPLINKVAFKYTGDEMCPADGKTNRSDIVEHSKIILSNCINCSRSLSIGYALNQGLITCQSLFRNIKESDFFIVKLEFELDKNFAESFSVFKHCMDNHYQESKWSLYKIRSDDALTFFHLEYVPINLKGHDDKETNITKLEHPAFASQTRKFAKYQHDRGKALTVEKKYECLFNKFVHEWTSTTSAQVIINFTQKCNKCENANESESLLIPHIGCLWYDKWETNETLDGCNFFKSIKIALNDLHCQGFHSVMIDEGEWDDLQRYTNACPSNCEDIEVVERNENLLNATIVIDPLFSQFFNNKTSTNSKQVFGIRIQNFACVIPLHDIATPASEILSVYDAHGDSQYFRNASEILELCGNIILYTVLEFKLQSLNHHKFMYDNVKNLKEQFLLAESIIKSKWPDKTITFLLSENTSELDGSVESETMYCNPSRTALFQYFETIFTWAEIFQIPLIVPSYITFPHIRWNSPLFWYKLIPDENISPRVQDTFPLYLRRAYNSSTVFGKWTNGMYPCLQWLDQVPLAIDFQTSQTGAYFHFDLRKEELNESEIFKMLAVTMTNFKTIEIKLMNLKEIKLFFMILTSLDFEHCLGFDSISKWEVFLNIPMSEFQEHRTLLTVLENGLKNINNNRITLKIHFSETYRFANEIFYMNHFKKHSGISLDLQACLNIVEQLGKVNGSSLKSIIYHDLLAKWSYIVCAIPAKNKAAESKLNMQKYLETHIYIKRILQASFPNLENVYFKMKPNEATPSRDDKEFLIFLSHMTDFSKGYNISFFLLPAFSSENSKELSWWDLSNYTDLSDRHVYRDIMSKYYKQKSLTPVCSFPRIQNQIIVWPWIIFGLIFCVVTVGALKRFRRKDVILSDEDVQEFLSGRGEGFLLTGECEFEDFHYNGHIVREEYDSQFEIDKGDILIHSDTILGVGNFGIVHKAKINTCCRPQEVVAVKMPKEGCEKQVFIGMLQEVKLLCYLRNHRNVVEFIGCYSKEIQYGTLYVVMELCTGGSLLSHLRNMKTCRRNVGQDEIFMDLVRFCLDISSGMDYIASRSVIHGDLSARNVLLDEFKVCKISDFGFSRKLYQYRTYYKKTKGPLPWRWMSYESLANLEFSAMSDVWSFGVTVWEIFSLGDIPYPGLRWTGDFMKELAEGLRLTMPTFGTSEIYEKMTTCWNIVPEERPTFSELFNFFVGFLPYTELSCN